MRQQPGQGLHPDRATRHELRSRTETMSDFVGYWTTKVADPELGLTFPMVVLYPTSTPSSLQAVGMYQLDVAPDAPIQEGVFPLVLISHGNGGSGLVYRTLAHYLARHGFVVGMPDHPFNNRLDNSWAKTAQNLANRPRHLQLAISHLMDHPRFAAFLEPTRVGLIGHSVGGYTALALAGGEPTSFPWESADNQFHFISTPTDSRVKALVLLAPAAMWFRAEGALRNVHVATLLLTAEVDVHTPSEHAQVILTGVPDSTKIQHRVVENAGHFSFLSPFPEARVSPAFPPSQDPPGFDRARFHDELNTEVLAFLSRAL
ncbi:alpha/beta hydrolase family protein [Hymenobacter sp. GOD-10R]|uniref:alpha/beta hydrolase family protein n=1 Tax=Hymenobacter sp. GOD-10R TaxID=3093922 RepID=UPI002D79E8CF|nr:alpha/beta fold hydrolase [Hymenobacter sp. GOD-10R]WRQ28695.1 alpha/beta fold hydrolase [Hymenobacter sp. GOD-10R]